MCFIMELCFLHVIIAICAHKDPGHKSCCCKRMCHIKWCFRLKPLVLRLPLCTYIDSIVYDDKHVEKTDADSSSDAPIHISYGRKKKTKKKKTFTFFPLLLLLQQKSVWHNCSSFFFISFEAPNTIEVMLTNRRTHTGIDMNISEKSESIGFTVQVFALCAPTPSTTTTMMTTTAAANEEKNENAALLKNMC